MKRVRITSGTVGLVWKNGEVEQVLTAGKYWIGLYQTMVVYKMVEPFVCMQDMDIVLRNQELADMLHVVTVPQGEIALQFEKGIFKRVLTEGQYAFWKGLVEYSFTKVDLQKIEITEDIDQSTLVKAQVAQYVRSYPVANHEKGLMLIDGKLDRVLDTGIYRFWRNSTQIQVILADMRQSQLDVAGQEILTADKAGLRINFYLKYKVVDAVKAYLETNGFAAQLYVLTQLALRTLIGKLTLDELLEGKSEVGEYVRKAVAAQASTLGVEILNAGIKDVILPGEMRDIMNQVLVAQKQAQASTIMRREETASTRSLLNTAKLMEDNEMLFKLKEMEYVEKIADKISSISLTGNSQVIDQLKTIFSPGK